MALKISEEKLLAAVTKTITVITNTSNVRVELDSFSRNESFTFVTCRAELHEGKYGRAVELLNASITDKTFTTNMSSILGVPFNMSVAYWMYSTDNATISTLYPSPPTGGTGGSSGGSNYSGGESTGSGDYQKGAHKLDNDPVLIVGKSVGLIMFHINSLE
jgi:hypothetical protein